MRTSIRRSSSTGLTSPSLKRPRLAQLTPPERGATPQALAPVTVVKRSLQLTQKRARGRRRVVAASVPTRKTAAQLLSERSLLESKSVGSVTQKRYLMCYKEFTAWCAEEEPAVGTVQEVDLAATAFLDYRYLEGDQSHVGSYLLAAINFVRTDFAAQPKEGLARLRRAVKGSLKTCPPQSRVPLPWEWAAGLAAIMQQKGHFDSAAALLIGFDTYIRPGALLKVRLDDVLQPVAATGLNRWGIQLHPQERGVLSKTGTMDDTVIFGNFDVDVVPLLKRLMRGKTPEMPLFSMSMKDYKAHFDEAAVILGLERFHLVTYQARHGGATRDILLGRRDQESVRKRGHWRTYTSLRRYEKSGRLQKVMQTTPPVALRYCQNVEKNILELWMGPAGAIPAVRRDRMA